MGLGDSLAFVCINAFLHLSYVFELSYVNFSLVLDCFVPHAVSTQSVITLREDTAEHQTVQPHMLQFLWFLSKMIVLLNVEHLHSL